MISSYRLGRAISDGFVSPPVFSRISLKSGEELWQAVCKKMTEPSDELSPGYLYSGFGGSGSDPSKVVAARKAICEIIERQAYYDLRKNSYFREKYGFKFNDSSDGMAAYPELFCRNVKRKAFNEAVERYAILSWWFGQAAARKIRVLENLNGMVVENFAGISVVVLWNNCELRSYGFACDHDIEKAIFHASIELSRNEIVLDNWNKISIPDGASIIEKRLLFFAQSLGKNQFDRNLQRSLSLKAACRAPKFVFDDELKGYWNRYVKVWRTVFEVNEKWLDNKTLEIFHF